MNPAEVEQALGQLQQKIASLPKDSINFMLLNCHHNLQSQCPNILKSRCLTSLMGTHRICALFVNQIKLIIEQQPTVYENRRSRVLLVGSLLTGTALQWFNPCSKKMTLHFESFLAFLKCWKQDLMI